MSLTWEEVAEENDRLQAEVDRLITELEIWKKHADDWMKICDEYKNRHDVVVARCKVAEDVLNHVPLSGNGNIYLTGFYEAVENWLKLKNKG